MGVSEALMWINNTDRDWEEYGRQDPYWAVLTDEQFHRDKMGAEELARFFESGEAHIAALWKLIQERVSASFAPRRCLEFGCGVGRLLLPMAERCEEAVGVDISDSMLGEAARHCAERGVKNVRLVKSDDALSAVSGRFDFIHSFIVFQHIKVGRGERILERLIGLLGPGGVGAVQVTYRSTERWWRRGLGWISKSVPFGQAVSNLAQRKPLEAPMMQMNPYRLERLLGILERHGIGEVTFKLMPQPGSEGALLLFRA